MDLTSLSPEERAALKAALDQEPEADPVQSLASAVQFLTEEQDAQKELIQTLMDQNESLKKLVMDELIGGLADAYNQNKDAEEFEGFKGKHGGMFEPFGEKFKATYGLDLLPKVHGYYKEMSSEDGFTEESGAAELEKIVNELKEKLGVAEQKLEEAKGEADEEPEEDAQAAWNDIERMKRRDDMREKTRKGA